MFTTVHTVNSKCECARVFVIKTLTNVDNQMEIDCDVDGLVETKWKYRTRGGGNNMWLFDDEGNVGRSSDRDRDDC